jgi:hypothetical protein
MRKIIVAAFLLLAASTEGSAARLSVSATVLPPRQGILSIQKISDNGDILITIKGGSPPYKLILKDPGLARVTQINTTTFRITGKMEGKGLLIIKDSKVSRVSCSLEICTINP